MSVISDTIRWKTLADLLQSRAETHATQQVYTFLSNDESEMMSITYAELDQQARAIATHLQAIRATEQRALLLYPPGLDFITAFLGCLYAGVVAVPTYPPQRKRANPRLQAIVQDAQPYVVLSHSSYEFTRETTVIPELSTCQWLITDQIDATLSAEYINSLQSADSLTFLQYTSGSTATPKGVMISHQNLLHNLTVIQAGFEITNESVGVLWCPPYHDMGLVSMLEVIYAGIQAVLLDPISMLQKPIRWLQAISDYRGTISGGPNFAYDLCVDSVSAEQHADLDLSSWAVAFNGAEPIRAETLSRFTQTFGSVGFRPETFYPCYGLSETVLIASGGTKNELPIIQNLDKVALSENRVVPASPDEISQPVVGCGYGRLGQKIHIVDPQTQLPCPPNQVGEIWLAGESIAQGYWNKPQETTDRFQAYFASSDKSPSTEGPYLRTGDLGFILNDELFVTGRLKELLIIRGQNHYPQDIERTVGQSHPALQLNGTAAFSVDIAGEERLVIVQEIKRTVRKTLQPDDVIKTIRQAVSGQHQLDVQAVLLLNPGSVPKTTSGKIQRSLCKEKFLDGKFSPLADDARNTGVNGQYQANQIKNSINGNETQNPMDPAQDTSQAQSNGNKTQSLREQLLTAPLSQRHETLLSALRDLVAKTCKLDVSHINNDDPLTSLGLSSLMAIRLIAEIEEALDIEFPVATLLEGATINDVTQLINKELAATATNATNGSQPQTPSQSLAQVPDKKSPSSNIAQTESDIPLEFYQFESFPEYQTFQHLFDTSVIQNPYFKPHQQVNNDKTRIDGRTLINFSSYNYLGLSGHPIISQASQAAIDQYGTSVSANRLVSGQIPLHGELEDELADLVGVPSALVFVGGHATNVTTIGHLLRPNDLILHDELIHNSALQGAALSGATAQSFPHNDWVALDKILIEKRDQFQRVLIVLEGVYSMDGDIPDLPRFVEIKQRHKALLMVDEAHSMGTIGPRGRGISDYYVIDPGLVDIWMGTLSKTFASCGGYIAGSESLIKYLKYTAPGFVYSVGMSPPNTAAALAAVRLLKNEPERAVQLQAQSKLFLRLAKERGLDTGFSKDSPIIPIIIGHSYRCSEMAKELFERGINVFPILFPAVPENAARLRFFLSNSHTEEQIRVAVQTVAEVFAELA